MCSGSYPAYFGEGTKLTVLEDGHNITAPEVVMFPPSKSECKYEKDSKKWKTLVCLAQRFYPDHVTVKWLINGEEVNGEEGGVATDPDAKKEDKFYSISSRLTVPAKTWFNKENKFTCNVRFFNGSVYEDLNKTMNGVPAPDEELTRATYIKTTQNLKLSYVIITVKSCLYGAFVVFLVWKLQGSRRK